MDNAGVCRHLVSSLKEPEGSLGRSESSRRRDTGLRSSRDGLIQRSPAKVGPPAALRSLVVVAAFALPASAAGVEAVSARAENWILVVYVAVMVAIGATVGAFVPKSSTASTRRGRALRWAGAGFLAAFIGYSAWLLILAG